MVKGFSLRWVGLEHPALQPHFFTIPSIISILHLQIKINQFTILAKQYNQKSDNETLINKRSFTLIELLIVVAIIGILAAIAVPNFMNARIRAKVSRAMADQRTMEQATLQYSMDANDNPPHSHDINQNWWLTTPVAYLNGFLYDPFQEIPIAQQLFDSEMRFTKRQYHWDPYDKRYWSGLQPSYFDPNVNPDFGPRRQSIGVIFGLGPATQYKGAGTQDWHPYEPSNGLYSIGLIRRYVPGTPKVDFAMP